MYAAQAQARGMDVLIASSDKDIAQLVNSKVNSLRVDVKGCDVDGIGCDVDVKGYSVDVKGFL